MGVLWETPASKKKEKVQVEDTTKIKLSKGQTVDTLILSARKLVEEKLGKYKDTSKCLLKEQELIDFFNQTPADGVIGIDTETTRLIFRPSINEVNQFIIGCHLVNG